MGSTPAGAVTSNSAPETPLQARVAEHQKAISDLDAERAQLVKQLEALRAEKSLLQAVARKVATRRSSGGGGVGGGQQL